MSKRAEGRMRRAEAIIIAAVLLVAAIAYAWSWLRGP
jgi:hypothetical protein